MYTTMLTHVKNQIASKIASHESFPEHYVRYICEVQDYNQVLEKPRVSDISVLINALETEFTIAANLTLRGE